MCRWAAIGVASGLVAICISIKSICPMSLLFFEIIESNFLSILCNAIFVLAAILASVRGTCLLTSNPLV